VPLIAAEAFLWERELALLRRFYLSLKIYIEITAQPF
jgi:hypothetical protein